MKRSRDGDSSSAPCVKVEYSNLPPESRKRLDELLQEWKGWHSNKYPPEFKPPHVLSGTVCYEAWQFEERPDDPSILPVLYDRPLPPSVPASQTMWFNLQYEKTSDVPSYDRESFLMHSTHYNQWVEAPLKDDKSPAPKRPRKKQSLTQRCFNCGSYGHTVRECWKERNDEAVEEARNRLLMGKTKGGQGEVTKRYFESVIDKSEGEDGEDGDGHYEGEGWDADPPPRRDDTMDLSHMFQAGHLSDALRQALGIGPDDPPPWAHKHSTHSVDREKNNNSNSLNNMTSELPHRVMVDNESNENEDEEEGEILLPAGS